MISRRSTSSWNSAPSIVTICTFGLSAAIALSDCTTSGQFWHDSDI
jgi:hypothetical protein